MIKHGLKKMKNKIVIKFKKLSDSATIPKRGSAVAAGYDLTVDTIEKTYDHIRYNSNIAVEIPKGYVGLLYPRSSVYKQNLMLTNGVGVIDSDYRGPIMAVFQRMQEGRTSYDGYKLGERFAQLVIMPIPEVEYIEAEELSVTERGTGGYGSTGK